MGSCIADKPHISCPIGQGRMRDSIVCQFLEPISRVGRKAGDALRRGHGRPQERRRAARACDGRREGKAAYAAALSSISGSAVSAFGCKPCRKAAARSAWAAAVKIARLSFFSTRNQFSM
jgi:hypothetical protein